MKLRLLQRWERASSFGFSALALRVGKKPNVLDRALGFYTDAQRFGAWHSGGFRSTKLSIHHKS